MAWLSIGVKVRIFKWLPTARLTRRMAIENERLQSQTLFSGNFRVKTMGNRLNDNDGDNVRIRLIFDLERFV